MKRVLSFVAVLSVLGSAYGATRAASSIELDTMPARRVYSNVDYNKYPVRSKTANYAVKDARDIYYSQPSSRSALYKQYDTSKTTNVRTTRSETLRTEMKRKYFLAHPFFQPLQYKFGSITDLSYVHNGYDMAFHGAGDIYADPAHADDDLLSLNGQSGKWKADGFAIKEDLSFGITDRVALMGMLHYNSVKDKYDWDSGASNSVKRNELDLWGLGVQTRFADTEKWIGMGSFYFENQKDIAKNFVLELKMGYKVSHSTIYGIGRGWLVDFDGNAYGNGTSGIDDNGYASELFLAYKKDVSNAFYGELGFGDFSVLDEDWTLNVEALFGYYDWHNQFSLKGAFGWQPNDWFALNLYGKFALYDSAKGKDVDVFFWRDGTYNSQGVALQGLSQMGTAHLTNYSEYSVGLQAMFMF